MGDDYYYRKQVVEIFDLEEGFLARLEEEELVHTVEVEIGGERVFPIDQVERLRIISNLVRDLDVNLAGVEVILAMRENMILMQRQFDKIIEALVTELKGRFNQ
jgi:MerR family transcriptional regulator/heat shock protein HspR